MSHQEDLLGAVLHRLDRGDASHSRWPDSKGEYWALCPFPPDTHASNFSVSTRGFKCFVCGASGSLKALATHLGLAEPPQVEGPTFARYACAKNLSESFLQGLGLSDRKYRGQLALLIPYYAKDSTEIARRYRLSLDGKRRFLWATGSKVYPYGLWRLDEAREAGYVILVEGESDCHTL